MSCEKKLAGPPVPVRAVSRTRLKVTNPAPVVPLPVNVTTTSLTDALLGSNPGSPKLGPTFSALLSVKAMPGLKLKPVGKGPVVFRTPKSLRLKAVGCVELMVLLLNIIGYVHSIPPDPSGAFVIGPTLIVFANAELAVSKAIAVAKVNVSFFVISYPCSICFFIYLSSSRKTAVSEFRFHQEWTMANIEHGLGQLPTG
jgi:hypothetical protein